MRGHVSSSQKGVAALVEVMDAATPSRRVPMSVNPSGARGGCFVVATALYVVTSLVIHTEDVVGSAVARLCAPGGALDVIDRHRLGEDRHYLVIARVRDGGCVSVRGEGVRPQGWDSSAPLIRVRMDDGRWGWVTLPSRPVLMTYAPHLAFVRAPFRTTLYLLGVGYVVLAVAWFVRACFGRA